jgi:hypothetical protein
MSSNKRVSLRVGILLIFFSAGAVRSDTEAPADPVREMLLAHFQTVQGSYRRMIESLPIPPDLGLSRNELGTALDSLQDALSHWKIEFRASYAAFAVQTATRLLVVNPQSMPSILEDDDDVLLHESVHLSSSQIQRELYGLHSELVFFEWLEDHLDEEKASRAETALNRTLSPDDVLRLRLWSSALRTDPAPLKAAEQAFRTGWICETQAYYVQMLAFDHQLKQRGAASLNRTADMLRKTLASETGFQRNSPSAGNSPVLVDEDDMALTLFRSFTPHRVSEGFQEAVLSCVLLDAHKGLLFQTLAEASGWSIQKAGKDPTYRRELFGWARRKILRWNSIKTDPTALNDAERNELRQNGLLAVDP